MEKVEYKKLSIPELEEIVKKCEEYRTNGCAGIACENCVCSCSHYKDIDPIGCEDVWKKLKKRLEELKGVSGDIYKDTFETIIITPETTSLKYMIETGYVHVLAEVFSDGKAKSALCGKSNCDTCKLHQRNYSTDIAEYHNCTPPINDIIMLSKLLKVLDKDTLASNKCNTCNSCGYLSRQGEYLFCNAWKNYTTEDMNCGYYTAIDN